MNIAHHLSDVMTWVRDKYKIYFTSLNGCLCGHLSSPYHKLAIDVKGPQVYEDKHIDKPLCYFSLGFLLEQYLKPPSWPNNVMGRLTGLMFVIRNTYIQVVYGEGCS